jgi:large subunit ribosomal protein L35
MPKVKSHKGLLKRVKITARGRVKFKRSCSSHLNSHMSGNKIRQLRGTKLVAPGDIKRVAAMLHRPLTSHEG